MPTIDFSKVDDVKDFEPLPDDRYLCRIIEIKEDSTQGGDEMWKLTHEILEGKYSGRRVFDRLVFSEKAMKRVKLILSRLGLDVSGEVALEPSMIKGKRCWVEVRQEDYDDGEGNTKMRNVVTFSGYEAVDDEDVQRAQAGKNDTEGNIPF